MIRTLALTACASALVMPAYAESTITFDLKLGGNNHAADWALGTIQPFEGGSDQEGVAYSSADILTWSVHVQASGDHNGFPILGVANVVWDLELWKDGALVSIGAGGEGTAGWFSTINDGDQDPGQAAADPLALAAFAWAFTLEENPPGTGPGRIFDEPADNGPHFAQYTYPSAAGYPPGSTAPLGMLVGMGAGYRSFISQDHPYGGGWERAGVGIVGADSLSGGRCDGLGTGPIAEGQLSTVGLPGGTYTLRLVSSGGNNVLRGDFQCNVGTEGNFAVRADHAVGDEISFHMPDGDVFPPVLTGAVSRRTHGLTGDFDILLPLTGRVPSEPRLGGPQRVVLIYDRAIGEHPIVTLSGGTLANVTTLGNELAVEATDVPDGTCLVVNVDRVTSFTGMPAVPHSVKLRSLFGDVNSSGATNAADAGLVKKDSLRPVDATNFRHDVNCSGAINAADVGLVKKHSLQVTAEPCTN